MSGDFLQRFLFAGLPVRGAVVRITHAWREALARRASVGAFPPPVRALLGEMTAAGILMHSHIKFDGALILQLHGDGALKLAVAEVKSDLCFRTTAQVTGPVDAPIAFARLVNPGGHARCAITLDAADRSAGSLPYQGIVPLHGDQREPLADLAGVLEHYMLRSEQLDTRIVLAADDEVAAGLLVQRMPASRGITREEDLIGGDEDFNRIAHLSASLTRVELLGLDVGTIMRRLYWQEGVNLFEPQSVAFRCSCSRERVRTMLVGLGRAEIESVVQERGKVEVGCDFCGLHYGFDAIDVGEMFTPRHEQGMSSSTLQ